MSIKQKGYSEKKKTEIARKICEELLAEAEEKCNEAYKKLVYLTHNLLRASLMSFSVGEDDKLLLEDEKSLLEKKILLLKEAHKNYEFLEERLERLKQYDYRKFFSQLESKDDIDFFLLEVQDID
jgi:hypothetical protein